MREGRFDLDRQIVKVGRPMDGIPGVVVIAPLVLGDGSAILVERGWAPSPDARRVELRVARRATQRSGQRHCAFAIGQGSVSHE